VGAVSPPEPSGATPAPPPGDMPPGAPAAPADGVAGSAPADGSTGSAPADGAAGSASGGAVAGSAPADVASLVAGLVRDVPDFPQPGVLFKDLTPLLADGPAFRAVTGAIVARHGAGSFDVVAGIEARGFLIAAAVAHAAGAGVVPIRKAGKLPWQTVAAAYTLEYGEATIEVHADAFAGRRRVLLVDDVLATGGTLAAAADLIGRAGGVVTGMSVVLELVALGGRERLGGGSWPSDLHSLLAL
jgi:adenine phosphoribosyltransferase